MFAEIELTNFRDKMLKLCKDLNVYYEDGFPDMLMDSACVHNTMIKHKCENLDELYDFFVDYLLCCPDTAYDKYVIAVVKGKEFYVQHYTPWF